MAIETWVVTTQSNRSIHDIATDLANAGLNNIHINQEIGIITGTSEDETIKEKLLQVSGVKDVSPDIHVDIGQPGSHDTW